MSTLLLLISAALPALVYGSLTVRLVSVLAVLLYWYSTRRPAGIPPGPTGVPLLGYLPFLGSNIHRTFNKLGKKYGPVFGVYMGDKLTVVLDDYDSIRKAFVDQGDAFSGRPHDMPGLVFETDRMGLINSDGPVWREQRRFALTTLRDFGIGKSSIEPAVLNELQYFLQAVESKNGEAFSIRRSIMMSVSNLVCILEFGHRFEYTNPYFVELNTQMEEFVRCVPSTGLFCVFPWMKYIPGVRKLGKLDKLGYYGKQIHSYTTKMMQQHRENYKPGMKDDYINAHFTETEERKKTGNFPEYFDDVCLENNLRVLFLAGTDTTSNTLLWGLLYMVLHPDVQRKVQAELDDVIGRQRMPSYEDRPNLPYTEATLLEIQRRGTVVPLSVPHRTMKDVELNGFKIPEDTTILPNIWSVHHDDKLFPDSMSFRPERFIDADGKVSKPDYLMPFSVGKRFCLGEPLARMELFLYFTSMMHKFSFKLPPGEHVDVMENSSIVNTPQDYRVIAVHRED
jgi:cytochrome P450 family 2 subfamily J